MDGIRQEVIEATRHDRHWQLILRCGHQTWRPVKYKRLPIPGRCGEPRDTADILPAPGCALCRECRL